MVRKVDWPSESRDPDDEEFSARLEALKARIRKIDGVAHTLRKLVRAGADEGILLHLLALVSRSTDGSIADEIGKRKKSVTTEIRKRKEEWESLALQMEALAGHADRLLNDPSSYAGFWLAVLGDNDDYRDYRGVAGEHHTNKLPTLMRSFAETVRTEARNLQWAAGRVRTNQRRCLSVLMLYVCETTGRIFDQEIATLLTDAFEANRNSRDFSADQIKKHRQRYVPRSRARNYFS